MEITVFSRRSTSSSSFAINLSTTLCFEVFGKDLLRFAEGVGSSITGPGFPGFYVKERVSSV